MRAVLLFLVSTLGAAAVADDEKTPEEKGPATMRVIDPTYAPQVGDQAFVDTGAKDEEGDPYAVVGAVSIEEFINYMQLQSTGNEAAVDKMESAKKLFLLDAGTEVLITGMRPIDFDRVQLPAGVAVKRAICTEIKVLTGEDKGKVLYTVMRDVKRYVTVPVPADQPAEKTKTKSKKGKSVKKKNTPAPAAKAATEKPAPDPSARAESMLKTGHALEKAGKTKGALQYYRDLVKQFPQSTQAKRAEERIKALGKGWP